MLATRVQCKKWLLAFIFPPLSRSESSLCFFARVSFWVINLSLILFCFFNLFIFCFFLKSFKLWLYISWGRFSIHKSRARYVLHDAPCQFLCSDFSLLFPWNEMDFSLQLEAPQATRSWEAIELWILELLQPFCSRGGGRAKEMFEGVRRSKVA